MPVRKSPSADEPSLQDDGTQRQVATGGGDYAGRDLDKRQGAFVTDATIHGNVIGQQTILAPGLSPRDRDNRQRMLAQVRRFWIAGVLEQSLYQEVLIALNLQTDPQAVSFVGPRLATQTDQEPQPLPPGTSIAQVYQEANQRLLIVGAPGAGKTTLLLDLARTLLDHAEHDERRPIPVVFNLSSWAQQRLPLEQWLVQELRDQYGVGRRLAQGWVRDNAILPLLDGLDEVAETHRAECVQAINTFCQEHGTEGIVVCSRVADYEAIRGRLVLDAAVLVQPLDDTQIDQYLAWGGAPLAGVQAVLAHDSDLRELVRTPLLLNILTLTYQGQHPQEFVGLPPEAQRRHLFDHYVQHMFTRRARSDPQRYTQAQTRRWLHWLAGRLAQENQTVFQMELMQPWWLRRWWQCGLYVLCSTGGATAGGGLLGVVFGLLFGLLVGLGLEVLTWGFPSAAADIGLSAPGDGRGVGLVFGLVFGLVGGLVFGLVRGLVFGLVFGLVVGLGVGPAAGFYFGGLAFVQHFALRLVCAWCGVAPWNYPRFLDYAVDRILLRRVGGNYIFVHRMLLDYFAEADRDQEAPTGPRLRSLFSPRGVLVAGMLLVLVGCITTTVIPRWLNAQQAQDYARQAVQHWSDEDYAAARVDFTRAIDLQPDNADYYHRRARVAWALDDYAAALDDATHAAQLDPDNPSYLNSRCWYGSLAGQATQVLEACTRAVELAPEDGGIRDSRGLARALTGNETGALEDFRFYVEWAEQPDSDASNVAWREAWIAALEAGENPFDEATLERLRDE